MINTIKTHTYGTRTVVSSTDRDSFLVGDTETGKWVVIPSVKLKLNGSLDCPAAYDHRAAAAAVDQLDVEHPRWDTLQEADSDALELSDMVGGDW